MDALAPVIYAKAIPHMYPSWLMYTVPSSQRRFLPATDLANGWTWRLVMGPMHVGADKPGVAVIAIRVELHNVSKQVARIQIPSDQTGFVYTEGDSANRLADRDPSGQDSKDHLAQPSPGKTIAVPERIGKPQPKVTTSGPRSWW